MPNDTPGTFGPTPSSGSSLSLLPILCLAVASRFPSQPACIAATALLVAAGEQFAVNLRPQPVSVWSGDPSGQTATGYRGRDFGLSMGGTVRSNNVDANSSDWFHEVGHMIAVSDEHRVVLDPTYGQFERPGAPSSVVMMQVPSLTLSGDEAWTLEEGGWVVRYWPVDGPDAWRSEYAQAIELIVPRHLAAVVETVSEQIS